MTPVLNPSALFYLEPMFDRPGKSSANTPYPACNVQKLSEESYVLTLAVPGYALDNLRITSKGNQLIVAGRDESADQTNDFLHREIPAGNFERTFQLADHVTVTGADLKDGLLRISLVREVPEAQKSRRIEIKSRGPQQQLERGGDPGKGA